TPDLSGAGGTSAASKRILAIDLTIIIGAALASIHPTRGRSRLYLSDMAWPTDPKARRWRQRANPRRAARDRSLSMLKDSGRRVLNSLIARGESFLVYPGNRDASVASQPCA